MPHLARTFDTRTRIARSIEGLELQPVGLFVAGADPGVKKAAEDPQGPEPRRDLCLDEVLLRWAERKLRVTRSQNSSALPRIPELSLMCSASGS